MLPPSRSLYTIYHTPYTLPAFTLIELIIAIAIFAVFMSTALAAYLQLSLALKRENIDRKLYSEIESLITDIQRQAKFYDIDYVGYSGSVSWPAEALKLIAHDGKSRIEYGKTTEGEIGVLKQDCTLEVAGITCQDAEGFTGGALLPLTSNELKVEYFAFYLHPSDALLVENDDPSQIIYQPNVTIVLRGQIFNPYRNDPREFAIQTTISMRHYQ